MIYVTHASKLKKTYSVPAGVSQSPPVMVRGQWMTLKSPATQWIEWEPGTGSGIAANDTDHLLQLMWGGHSDRFKLEAILTKYPPCRENLWQITRDILLEEWTTPVPALISDESGAKVKVYLGTRIAVGDGDVVGDLVAVNNKQLNPLIVAYNAVNWDTPEARWACDVEVTDQISHERNYYVGYKVDVGLTPSAAIVWAAIP